MATVAAENEFIKKRMIKDSAILWVGTTTANFSNYLFHLFMGRFLGPVDYGVLASLIAVLYFMMVPMGTIQIVAMKFTAEFKAEGNYSKVYSLLSHLTKRLFLTGACLFIFSLLMSKLISDFLNIDSVIPVAILSFVFLISYLIPVNRGILQGLQDFFQLSLNFSMETVLKLIVGLGLVYAGFRVSGAVIGIAVGISIAYMASFVPLKFLFTEKQLVDIQLVKVAKYSVPVFIAYMCLTAYYSIDIILVKHFFNSVQAGLYSGLAILGKIVVFASLAISGVMFPTVTALHKQDRNYNHFLSQALILVSTISGTIVLAYYIAPSFIIKNLFPQYVSVTPYLGIFGFAMLLLGISSVFIYYFLAIQKTDFIYFLVIVALIQGILIWFFHNSIIQVVWVMVYSMAFLTLGLVIFHFFGRSFSDRTA